VGGMAALHHVSSDGTLITAFSDQGSTEQVALDGLRYTEFDRRPGLSFGMYWLGAGVHDLQSPHTEDEIYVVASGSARILIGGEAHNIEVGSVISVPRNVEHKFVDITEDLALIVVFGPPEGELRPAGAAPETGNAAQT